MLTLRRARAGDAAALRTLFHGAVHQLAQPFYSAEQLQAWAPDTCDAAAWERKIAALAPWVAHLGPTLAGYADLQADGLIDHFFVAPACARQGVGSALLRHLVQQAQARGIAQLHADVSLAAEGLFARHGFAVQRRQQAVVRGVALANARMVFDLSSPGTP